MRRSKKSPKVAVVGGGVLGVCVSYQLALRGASVTLYESADSVIPRESAGFGNAGHHALTISRASASLSEVYFSTWKIPLKFAVHFLASMFPGRSLKRYEAQVALARYSDSVFDQVVEREQLPTGTSRGVLSVFRKGELLPDTEELIELGEEWTHVDTVERYAILKSSDRAFECKPWLESLWSVCQEKYGCLSKTNTRVTNVERLLDDYDEVVVCAGARSGQLVDLPMLPLKGYSLTIERGGELPLISTPFSVGHVYFCNGADGSSVRVAGIAEVAGFDEAVNVAALAQLQESARVVYPQLDLSTAKVWSGFRPVMPDGVPAIGQTKRSHVWVCAGHSTLGWTLGMGSAALITGMIMEDPLEIDASPFDPKRFSF